MINDWREDRVGAALRGDNPTVIARLAASFVAIGDVQWLPGYCVLLSDEPTATRLSDLPKQKRHQFLLDLDAANEAIERACGRIEPGFRRTNIEILGNTDPYLHAHVWPRYDWEPPELVTKPVWLYPAERWSDPATALGPQHAALAAAIAAELGTPV